MMDGKNAGKAVSMLCFVSGLIFTVAGGIVALVRGSISTDWTGIVGLGFAIAQIALPVNISKIIQNLKGGSYDTKNTPQ